MNSTILVWAGAGRSRSPLGRYGSSIHNRLPLITLEMMDKHLYLNGAHPLQHEPARSPQKFKRHLFDQKEMCGVSNLGLQVGTE